MVRWWPARSIFLVFQFVSGTLEADGDFHQLHHLHHLQFVSGTLEADGEKGREGLDFLDLDEGASLAHGLAAFEQSVRGHDASGDALHAGLPRRVEGVPPARWAAVVGLSGASGAVGLSAPAAPFFVC